MKKQEYKSSGRLHKARRIGCESFRRRGFTIIELLTVMSVILILMSLLVPALQAMRRQALLVKQKYQFKGINTALQLFHNDRSDYPDSGEFDRNPNVAAPGMTYCGAMKLAEAIVGQDLLGFNPLSKFYQLGTGDGLPANNGIPSGPVGTVPFGNDLYPGRPDGRVTSQLKVDASVKERNVLYLELENANANKLGELYDMGLVDAYFGTGAWTIPVLSDVYPNVQHRRTGRNVGMPILYFKANVTKTSHEFTPQMIPSGGQHLNPYNTYNFWDNDWIVRMGIPNESVSGARGTTPQPMASDNPKFISNGIDGPPLFYKETWNQSVPVAGNRPYRSDSYILMSAGFDGLYGTKDDVFNFE